MNKPRFAEKTFAILKGGRCGVKISELPRKNGVSEAALYKCKPRCGSLSQI